MQEKRKMVTPINYSKIRIGRDLAVCVVIGACIIMGLLIKGGAPVADMKYFAIAAVALATLCVIRDIIINRKNREKISRMNYLLECPSVRGEVKEIKKYTCFFGKVFPENPKIYVKSKHRVYRIVVTFYDVTSDSEKTVASEIYYSNPHKFMSENYVNVHYSHDGDYWIDPIQLNTK